MPASAILNKKSSRSWLSSQPLSYKNCPETDPIPRHVQTSATRISPYRAIPPPRHVQGWETWTHAHLNENLNPSTAAKPVMTKLQNLFVALVNMDTFQMTLKLSLFTVDF